MSQAGGASSAAVLRKRDAAGARARADGRLPASRTLAPALSAPARPPASRASAGSAGPTLNSACAHATHVLARRVALGQSALRVATRAVSRGARGLRGAGERPHGRAGDARRRLAQHGAREGVRDATPLWHAASRGLPKSRPIRLKKKKSGRSACLLLIIIFHIKLYLYEMYFVVSHTDNWWGTLCARRVQILFSCLKRNINKKSITMFVSVSRVLGRRRGQRAREVRPGGMPLWSAR